jgi:hypothetical protein
MKPIKIFFVALIAIALAVILFVNNLLESSNLTSEADSVPLGTISETIQLPKGLTESATFSETGSNDFESEWIKKLKTNYMERIHDLTVQASLISVKKHVLNLFPNDGADKFERIIRGAFPSYASAILRLIERLEAYNQWLIESQLMLSELPDDAREGAIWMKRRELFGDDADILWSAEIEESEQKQMNIHAQYKDINDANETTLDEKLYQLQAIINENLGDTLQDLTLNPGVVSQAFFNFDSVQHTLNSLSPEDRQLAINDVRRQLGFDEESIIVLQANDAEKNKRWDNGLSYMQARQTLLDTLSGESLETALSELRQKHFGIEAPTIEKEEQSDFFRFERRRIYGRN